MATIKHDSGDNELMIKGPLFQWFLLLCAIDVAQWLLSKLIKLIAGWV